MTHPACECKSMVDIITGTNGTPTVKLVAVLIACGVTDTKLIAAATGLKLRAAQAAKNAAQCAQHTASAQHNAPNAAQCAQHTASLARAYKESLRDKSNIKGVDIDLASSQSDALPAPAVPAPAKPDATRGSRLPEGWTLPDDWRQWAEINTQLGRAGIATEADKFRDYWHAQPGVRGRKVSWSATWRNWCRNVRAARPYSAAQLAWDERNARLRAEGKPTTVREALRLRAAEAAALEAAA